ncbi:hypothetical protein LINGRAHAP2_LOCUS25715 [Linum grandiflorum]
MLCFGL